MPFKNLNEFADLLTTKMLSAHEKVRKVDERKQKLFHLLVDTKGLLSVDEISKTLFWGSRQINRVVAKVIVSSFVTAQMS